MTEQEYADLQTLEALRGCRALLKGCIGDVEDLEHEIAVKIAICEKFIKVGNKKL